MTFGTNRMILDLNKKFTHQGIDKAIHKYVESVTEGHRPSGTYVSSEKIPSSYLANINNQLIQKFIKTSSQKARILLVDGHEV